MIRFFSLLRAGWSIRPRPWLFLAAFTVLSALTYTLLP